MLACSRITVSKLGPRAQLITIVNNHGNIVAPLSSTFQFLCKKKSYHFPFLYACHFRTWSNSGLFTTFPFLCSPYSVICLLKFFSRYLLFNGLLRSSLRPVCVRFYELSTLCVPRIPALFLSLAVVLLFFVFFLKGSRFLKSLSISRTIKLLLVVIRFFVFVHSSAFISSRDIANRFQKCLTGEAKLFYAERNCNSTETAGLCPEMNDQLTRRAFQQWGEQDDQDDLPLVSGPSWKLSASKLTQKRVGRMVL